MGVGAMKDEKLKLMDLSASHTLIVVYYIHWVVYYESIKRELNNRLGCRVTSLVFFSFLGAGNC